MNNEQLRITNDEEFTKAREEAIDLYGKMEKLDALGADVSAEILSEELHVMLMDLIPITQLSPEQQRHVISVVKEFKKKIDARAKLGDDEYQKHNRLLRIYTTAIMATISRQHYTYHEPSILDEAERARG